MLGKFILKKKLKSVQNRYTSKYVFIYKNLTMVVWKDKDIFHNETFIPTLYYKPKEYSDNLKIINIDQFNTSLLISNIHLRININNLNDIKDKNIIKDSIEMLKKVIKFLKEEK